MISRFSQWLLAAILLSFISCSKEVSTENKSTGGKGDFYATINGNLWNADSIQQALVGSNGVGIGGLSKTGEEVSMILPELKTGTYTLNAQSVSYALDGNVFGTVSTLYLSNISTAGGTVTITAIDTANHLVSGNFQFNLINPTDLTTKVVTNGIFDFVPYIVDLNVTFQPPLSVSTDTLYAVIDGVQFNSGTVQTVIDNTNSQLTIAGIAAGGPQDITLLMPADITAGTYNLDYGSGIYVGIYNPTPNVNLYSQASGQLTIISNDPLTKRIVGSFDFTASPISGGTPVVITGGYFSVIHQ